MTDDIERRVADALRARAESTDPSPDGLDRIEERLMQAPTFTPQQRKALTIAAVAAAVMVFAVSGLVLATRDGDDTADVATDTSSSLVTTTTTTLPTTTTETTTTTTTTAPVPTVDAYSVAFPPANGERRFDEPSDAASAYAAEVLGFEPLALGEFQQGDSRSGEFAVTDGRDGAAVTTVFVRQMEDDTWFVLGSQAPDIMVTAPTPGAALASPFQTTGTALAFEGTVDVVVWAQDAGAQVGGGFVTGNGTPPAGPFDGRIEFNAPGAEAPGVMVYRTHSAEDGHVLQATSFPVRLTDR